MSPAPPPFDTLVRAHGAAVLRVCRALVGVGDADDLWQETFLAALRAYPSGTAAGEPVRNWEAWLVRIARNQCLDHLRRAARLPQPQAAPDPGRGTPEDAVEGAVAARDTAQTVWAALATLPPKQREGVVYHHLAGLPYAEVAPLLGNSEAAARRATADGMAALRRRLRPAPGGS